MNIEYIDVYIAHCSAYIIYNIPV